jgi:hypothetical protein
MEKFSVIIPTMWKSEYTIELLERYCASDYVGEIILINNNRAETPQIFTDYKLKVITPKENIYVNPAWNKGVYEGKYPNVTISNDDILFDVDEYYESLEQANNILEVSYIGSHSENYTLDKSADVRIELLDCQNNLGGWGCLFSFHKNNWRPIPEQLKIWYGDNWIHGTAANIFQLRGLAIKTKMSTSSDLDEVRSVRDNDTIEWHKLLGNG